MEYPVIALLTDFGTHDPYAGIMKGVIMACVADEVRRGVPPPTLIDITHEVAPQNVTQGAYLLRAAYRYFPPHTVFLVVVDPGVGTSRRAVMVKTPRGTFIGPDNGVLRLALDEIGTYHAYSLRELPGISATFHGRDVFAPAAAGVAYGRTPDADPVRYLQPGPTLRMERPEAGHFVGEVIHIDGFGNIISSLGPFTWQDDGLVFDFGGERLRIEPERAAVAIGATTLKGIHRTYGMAAQGEALALISSDGKLEIAVNQGNAAAKLNIQPGDTVRLTIDPAVARS